MRAFQIALPIVAAVLLTGCIRHKVLIQTEPSEAKVTWNKEYRGRTPIEIPFIWHWKYTLDIEREGYKPMSTVVHLRTKPWFWAPMGLILEAIPLRFTDTRHLHYTLEPDTATPAGRAAANGTAKTEPTPPPARSR